MQKNDNNNNNKTKQNNRKIIIIHTLLLKVLILKNSSKSLVEKTDWLKWLKSLYCFDDFSGLTIWYIVYI